MSTFKTTLYRAVCAADEMSFCGYEVEQINLVGTQRVRLELADERRIGLDASIKIEIDEGGVASFEYTDEDGETYEAEMTFEASHPLTATDVEAMFG